MAAEPITSPRWVRALRLTPFEARYADWVLSWVRGLREGYWLAPRTKPPLTVEKLREKYKEASIPLGRVGKLSEIADTVCFLASDRAGYIHGTTVNVSGGKTRA